MSNLNWYGLNRTLCDVLTEMRDLLAAEPMTDTKQALLKSLVEEAQVFGNRMEAALSNTRDLENLHERIKKAKKQIKTLEAKKEKLGGKEEDDDLF